MSSWGIVGDYTLLGGIWVDPDLGDRKARLTRRSGRLLCYLRIVLDIHMKAPTMIANGMQATKIRAGTFIQCVW